MTRDLEIHAAMLTRALLQTTATSTTPTAVLISNINANATSSSSNPAAPVVTRSIRKTLVDRTLKPRAYFGCDRHDAKIEDSRKDMGDNEALNRHLLRC